MPVVTNNNIYHQIILLIIICLLNQNIQNATAEKGKADEIKPEKFKELDDHTLVTDSELFPYVVAILKKTTYMSTGALINENWVLTAADALFLVRESSRTIRIRLGSTNHKKGGVLMPIKYIDIHPYFDDNKPQYDIALIRLSHPVTFTSSLNAIKLQTNPRKGLPPHFVVTGWQTHSKVPISEEQHQLSMETIKRRRLLSVSRLHPTDPEECSEQLTFSGLNHSKTLMCLDPAVGTDPCERQAGAPVVLNGILWGIISSWKPEDCEDDPGLTFVTMVAAGSISSWIHETIVLGEKKKGVLF